MKLAELFSIGGVNDYRTHRPAPLPANQSPDRASRTLFAFVHIYANIRHENDSVLSFTQRRKSRRDISRCFVWQAQKAVWVLRLIEELERVPAQYFKKLVNTEGIWEVRVQLGNDAFRLLGFFAEPTLLVLTNGFAKKTQKTPAKEIATALRRRADYIAERKQQ